MIIRAVIFDLGNVLCRFDWHASLERLAHRVPAVPPGEIVDWLLGPTGPHDPYCRGEIDEEQLLGALHERIDPRRELDDVWLTELWCDMFTEMPGSMELVDELRGQVHLGMISNTNRLHFEHLDEMLELRRRFDSLTLSYELGALKPSPTMYETALAAAGTPAAQTCFIDDIADFARAAEAVGMRGVSFQSVAQLRGLLRSGGLDVAAA